MSGLLEKELAATYSAHRARVFRRGSKGLFELFRAVAQSRGPGEIVVPNLCCETVALAARFAGHETRFADVDPDRFCVTPESVAAAMNPLTRVVVVVHLFGLTVEAECFRELRDSRPEVIFVEDVAHAVGGRNAAGEEVGSGFDHCMFSFSDSKILRGEGGAIVSRRDDDITDRFHQETASASAGDPDPLLALSLRNLVHALADLHRAAGGTSRGQIDPSFWDHYRDLIVDGGEFRRVDEALADLRARDEIRQRRRLRADRYRESIHNPAFAIPEILPEETCWRLALLAETPALRRRATEAIRAGGLHASNHYFALSRLFPGEALPVSESISDRIINLWVDDKTSESHLVETARILNSI